MSTDTTKISEVHLRDLTAADLGENNDYVYIRDDGMQFVPELGREVYQSSMWRLVLGRDHGTPVFEPVEVEFSEEDVMAEEDLAHWFRFMGATKLVIDEQDFIQMTGHSLGEAVFDGPTVTD